MTGFLYKQVQGTGARHEGEKEQTFDSSRYLN